MIEVFDWVQKVIEPIDRFTNYTLIYLQLCTDLKIHASITIALYILRRSHFIINTNYGFIKLKTYGSPN